MTSRSLHQATVSYTLSEAEYMNVAAHRNEENL